MITRKTVRSAVQLVQMIGTGLIVNGVISNNTAPRSLPEKAAVKVAAFGVGAAVTEKTEPAMDKLLDGVFEAYDSFRDTLKK